MRSGLEDAFALIETPQQAEAVVAHLEQAAAGKTEHQQGEAAVNQPQAPGERVVQSEQRGDRLPSERTAAAIVAAASEAVAPAPTAPAVVEGARDAAGTQGPSTAPTDRARVHTGRQHLKQAVLRRMPAGQRLDARVFLTLNQAPHPDWLNRLADWLAITSNGGWLWLIGVAAAGIAGAPDAGRLLVIQAPTVAASALLVEYPIKAIFRRRRPFIDVVRALVIGKQPGSWSFPSGHTATAFAAAVVAQGTWPRSAPLLYTLATLTGLSRIYVGVHYPGDVLSGALLGALIGSVMRTLGSQAARASRLRRRG